MIEKLLTPDDVAQVLQVSRRTAYRIMHQMPHLETPFRVTENGLRAWLNDRTAQPAAPGREKEKPRLRAVKMPLVGDGLHIPRRRAQ